MRVAFPLGIGGILQSEGHPDVDVTRGLELGDPVVFIRLLQRHLDELGGDVIPDELHVRLVYVECHREVPAWAAGVGGGGFPGAPTMLGMNVNTKCIEMKHDCFSVADLGGKRLHNMLAHHPFPTWENLENLPLIME